MKSKVTLLVSVLVLGVFSNCASVKLDHSEPLIEPVTLPNPSGHFSVGMKRYQFKDSSRIDPFSDSASVRELAVNIYYPATDVAESKELPYVHPKMLEYYKKEMPKGGLDGRYLEHIATGVIGEAPVSTHLRRYPVIILSPGGGVVPDFYLSLIRELVSHAFVVVGINHTYIAPISIFPDGTVKLPGPTAAQFRSKISGPGGDPQGELVKIQAADIELVLHSLQQIDFQNHLDLSNIGMLGHSLGGMAITYLCLNYSKCHAGVNMDGPLLGGPSSLLRAGDLSGDLTKPFLFLIGKSIAQSTPQKDSKSYANKDILEALWKVDQGLSLEEFYDFQKDRHQGRIVRAAKKMGKKASIITFESAEHMAFSDWRLINSHLLKDSEKADLLHFMKQLNGIAVNFFSKHLMKER